MRPGKCGIWPPDHVTPGASQRREPSPPVNSAIKKIMKVENSSPKPRPTKIDLTARPEITPVSVTPRVTLQYTGHRAGAANNIAFDVRSVFR